jgi:hypothetical protein
MKKSIPVLVFFFCLLLTALAIAQGPIPSPEGVDRGNYNYQGSAEFGYRFVDVTGNEAIYGTYVDEREGPRLLEQTLSMRSLNHEATLFDNLYVSSFGWGGDPENVGRARISKNKWYNFGASFRRDINFWNYNLLANPLNPTNSFIPVTDSPHEFHTTRRMYDYNLTILPQSPVRFRLGYTRNNMEGPSFNSFHEGTDVLLFQNWRTLLDGYQAGVDVRLLPRTNISYDQFLQYYRGDTNWQDQNLTFRLSDGTPVDAGLIYNTTANQPCSNTPVPVFNSSTDPSTLKATCNGYLSYNRFAPVRVSYPVEQLTLQSRYFRRLDISARGSYSSSDSKVNGYNESYLGLVTRTAQRTFDISGQTRTKRVVANADFGVTVHVTDRFRLVDSFRFSNFRIPGSFVENELSAFPLTTPGSMLGTIATYDPATCPSNAASCPKHSSSSPADVSSATVIRFLGQNSKYNTFEAEYDFTRRIGARIGYRFGRRRIPFRVSESVDELFYPSSPNRGDCASEPLNPDGTCSFAGEIANEEGLVEVNEHSGLFGIWVHPTDALRVNFDAELFSGDNAPTRITPRNLQRYKGRVQFKPYNWMNVSGSVNVLESRNNIPDVLHREHNRNYGFSTMVNPKSWLGFEVGYNYDDIFSTTNICYVITATPPTDSTLCRVGTPFLAAESLYDNKIHFGYTTVMFKPVKRVTVNLGYNATGSTGNTLILSPTPDSLGTLDMIYHKPMAGVEVELAKGFSWRTMWGYYGYNEKSDPGVLPNRDFHSNSATLSLRYAF